MVHACFYFPGERKETCLTSELRDGAEHAVAGGVTSASSRFSEWRLWGSRRPFHSPAPSSASQPPVIIGPCRCPPTSSLRFQDCLGEGVPPRELGSNPAGCTRLGRLRASSWEHEPPSARRSRSSDASVCEPSAAFQAPGAAAAPGSGPRVTLCSAQEARAPRGHLCRGPGSLPSATLARLALTGALPLAPPPAPVPHQPQDPSHCSVLPQAPPCLPPAGLVLLSHPPPGPVLRPPHPTPLPTQHSLSDPANKHTALQLNLSIR